MDVCICKKPFFPFHFRLSWIITFSFVSVVERRIFLLHNCIDACIVGDVVVVVVVVCFAPSDLCMAWHVLDVEHVTLQMAGFMEMIRNDSRY